MSMFRTRLISRLDARDRETFHRWVAVDATAYERAFWKTITHLGGAILTIGLVLFAIYISDGELHRTGLQAAVTLVATHLAAQGLKRTVTRPRPSGMSFEALVDAPDRFSFPSGHAIAASSLAFVFSWQYPTLAPALLVIATLVAVSRVRLGVHYPGDVLVGQGIALIGAMTVVAVW